MIHRSWRRHGRPLRAAAAVFAAAAALALPAAPALADPCAARLSCTSAAAPTGAAPGATRTSDANAVLGQVGSEADSSVPVTVLTLDGTTLGGPWLVAGATASLGVLLGVLRAALVSRRRPLPATN